MRITFVRLPFFTLLSDFKPYYHIGLGYLSAVLKEKGHDVALIDGETMTFEGFNGHNDLLLRFKTRLMPSKCLNLGLQGFNAVMEESNHQVWKTMADAVVSSNPDLIGMTCFTQNATAIMHLTRVLKNLLPDVPVVLGGIHPTAAPELTMRELKDVDYIVVGEGEETIIELCEVVSENKKQLIPEVKGIIYRENEQIKYTPPRPLIHNLDSLPFPDRTLGEKCNYTNADTIFTGRGCPFKCNFCASNILWSRKVRYRSVDNVLEEIDFLINHHNATRIRIVDDIFTLTKKYVLDFCNQIKERGFAGKVTFSVGSRVDTLDEEMIQQLAEIGTVTISFGIESGSPKILEEIYKKISPATVEDTVRLVGSYGIRCLCYFMIGHPDETTDDVKQSIELFDRISSRYVDSELNIVTPYPGTQLWDIAKEKGWSPSSKELHKFFHQGEFAVNLSAMSDQVLKDYYSLFLRKISRHGIVCKASTLGRLFVTGQIRTAFCLVFN